MKETSVQLLIDLLLDESNPEVILDQLANQCFMKAASIRTKYHNDELADKYANVCHAINDIMKTVQDQGF